MEGRGLWLNQPAGFLLKLDNVEMNTEAPGQGLAGKSSGAGLDLVKEGLSGPRTAGLASRNSRPGARTPRAACRGRARASARTAGNRKCGSARAPLWEPRTDGRCVRAGVGAGGGRAPRPPNPPAECAPDAKKGA